MVRLQDERLRDFIKKLLKEERKAISYEYLATYFDGFTMGLLYAPSPYPCKDYKILCKFHAKMDRLRMKVGMSK